MSDRTQARVLVVEDELLIAMDLVGLIEELGFVPLEPAASIENALAIVERDRPDAALLDENIAGRSVSSVAERLVQSAVPFTVVSGNVRSTSSEPVLRNAQRLQKPVTITELAGALKRMLGLSETTGVLP